MNASNFRIYSWYGEANGTALTPDFKLTELKNQLITIKRIKFIPYAKHDSTNLYISKGADIYIGQIPANARLDTSKIFDQYTNGLKPVFKVNGINVGFFPSSAYLIGYPIDLDCDNLNIKIPHAVTSIEISAVAKVFYDISIPDQLVDYCNMKVVVELFLNEDR